jgi:hypothetical protein
VHDVLVALDAAGTGRLVVPRRHNIAAAKSGPLSSTAIKTSAAATSDSEFIGQIFWLIHDKMPDGVIVTGAT